MGAIARGPVGLAGTRARTKLQACWSSRGHEAAEGRNECGGRGLGTGWAAPPSSNAVRAARRWTQLSVAPSIWGRRVCIQPWTLLDFAVRSRYGPIRHSACASSLCPLPPRLSYLGTLSSSLSLGIATPALVLAVTGCNTAPAQSETERPVCSPVCLRPLPRRDQYNTASETRNVWRCRVLLTGNFPSTITAPATVMLVLMHISSGISRPSVAMLTSCR